ncbi:MAG TPA: hypothetical protein VMZ71_14000, partial [Gemmataceae bacterium]|nr:hypothetical protein [Gemmataceae bacterium]
CYRDAIILCDLRGVTRTDAATALGVPEGTLSSRLANGRKKLADRLARRGIALSVAAIPAVLAEARAAPVPETLIAKTCGLAADAAAGVAVAAEVVRLTQRGIDVRKMLAIGVLGAALTAVGVVFAARPDADPQKKPDPPKPPAAEQADAVKPEPKAIAYTSAPRIVSRYDVPLRNVLSLHWNRAGTRIVVGGNEADPAVEGQTWGSMQVLTLKPWGIQPIRISDKQQLVGFAPDGEGVLTEQREYNLLSGHHRLSTWRLMDPPAAPPGGGGPPPGMGGPPGVPVPSFKVQRSLELSPDRTTGYVFSADGKTFRTVAVETDPSGEKSRLEVREVDAGTGETLKTLAKAEGRTFALSPDGKRLATVTDEIRLSVVDLDTGKSRVTPLPEPQKEYAGQFPNVSMVFSADGKRVVVGGWIGRTFVVNADTGELLPALEGLAQSETRPSANAFTSDGRMVALSGSRFTVKKSGRGQFGGEQTSITRAGGFVGVWDIQTGKALKVWERGATVGFSPTAPVLATIEQAGPDISRLGLWNFAADE